MYVYPTLFCVSEGAGMDGCVWMVLDDALFIVHVVNNGLGGLRRSHRNHHRYVDSNKIDIFAQGRISPCLDTCNMI